MKRASLLRIAWVCVVLNCAGLIRAEESAGVSNPLGDMSSESNDADSAPIQLAAALPSVLKFTTMAAPTALTADPVVDFSSADGFRKSGDFTTAVQRYMALIEEYPDSAQASAADRRMGFLVLSLPEADLDKMELGFPPTADLKSIFSKTMAAQFYFNRALRLMETDQPRALDYVAEAMDLAWDIMQGNHDDPYKTTIVQGYLTAADLTGQGDQVRETLSRYADTIDPNFTSWLIKALVDGEEPPVDFVTTYDAKDAIKAYFIQMAKGTDDAAEKTMYFRKARDLCRQMLADLDPDQPSVSLTATYLQAAQALGKGEFDVALAVMENFLRNEAPSIKRWVARYELGMAYVTTRRTPEEHLAGVAHFETVVLEGDMDLILPVINDTSIKEDVRGLVMCFLAHAHLGTGRLAEAEEHYEWVLEYYPVEAHAGDSANCGLMEAKARKEGIPPLEAARLIESIADANPSGSYAKGRLLKAAGIREKQGDLDGAAANYHRIKRDYPKGSEAKVAETRLAELAR
jgi:TolA-binding protein